MSALAALAARAVLCAGTELAASGTEVLWIVIRSRAASGELIVDAEEPAVAHFDGLANATCHGWGVLVPEKVRVTLVDLVSETSEAKGAGREDLFGCAPPKIRRGRAGFVTTVRLAAAQGGLGALRRTGSLL